MHFCYCTCIVFCSYVFININKILFVIIDINVLIMYILKVARIIVPFPDSKKFVYICTYNKITIFLGSFSRLRNEWHNFNPLTFFFRVWPWLISRRRRRLSVAVAPHGLEKMRRKRRKNRTRRNRKRRKRQRPRRMTIGHATAALRRWGKLLPVPGHREQDSLWNFN